MNFKDLRMIRYGFLFLIALFWVARDASGQLNTFEDIEGIGKEGFFKNTFKGFFRDFADFGTPFQLGGGFSLNMRSYDAYGGSLRQDPFFYTVNTHLNARIYQIDIPISMVFTAKNANLSYPSFGEIKDALKNSVSFKNQRFARIGISPYYKWAKIHLGHRTMAFSKYTMNNINFFGAGAELTPDKMRVGFMYGRLAKAEPIDLSLTTPNLPIYQRQGWGTRLGYGDDTQSIDLVLFGAKDDPNSVFVPADYPNQVAPESNFVLGLQLQKLLYEKFRLKLDYNNSATSLNAIDGPADKRKLAGLFLPSNNSTIYGSAIEGSIAYEGQKFNAGILMNRVDPNFRTFGSYFFNRDIFDIQGFTNISWLDGKLTTMLKGGIQSNNLDDSKPSTTRRFIYDVQLAWAHEHLSINTNYSNNTSSVAYVLNRELDSLNAVIVTCDMGLNINYTIPSEGEFIQVISLTGNIQDVSDDLQKQAVTTTSKMLLGNITYMITTPSKWAYSIRANYNKNEIENMLITRTGFGAGVRKSFKENKISIGFDGNYYSNKSQIQSNSSNIIGQIFFGYELFKGMNLNLQWGLLNTSSDLSPTFTESTGNLGLNYQFNYTPQRKSEKK